MKKLMVLFCCGLCVWATGCGSAGTTVDLLTFDNIITAANESTHI